MCNSFDGLVDLNVLFDIYFFKFICNMRTEGLVQLF